MSKQKLVYMWSLRNAAADQAGRAVPYQGEQRYMPSVLEFLAGCLAGPLGERYELVAVINDDDPGHAADVAKLAGYGFARRGDAPWLYPAALAVNGTPLDTLLLNVPSSYRRERRGSPAHVAGKRAFEQRLHATLDELQADVVVLDGLLVILDELVRPGAAYARRIMNIHPGVTRDGSLYQRRGAYATLDALHGARGEHKDWASGQVQPCPPVMMTGASFHYVDTGIDSGEVFHDVLATHISPTDTILELRWNNFQRSLFPALEGGLTLFHAAG